MNNVRKKMTNRSKQSLMTKSWSHLRSHSRVTVTVLLVLTLVIAVSSYLFYRKIEQGLILGLVSNSYTLTTQTDWEVGEYYGGTIDTKSSSGDMKIKSGYVGEWDKGTPGFTTDTAGYDYWSYDGASYGADLTTDGTYIYQIVGNRRPYLFRYNPEINTWKKLADAPTAFLYGGSITYDGEGHIFAIDGGEQTELGTTATKHMYRYDLATDSWTKVADAPNNWGLGASIAANQNGTIYAVRGYSTDTLWSYDIESNVWNENLPAMPAPYVVYTTNGQPLEYVNETYGTPEKCTQGCLYVTYGNGNRQFFRFDIAESQWYYNTPTDLTIPAALGGVHYGSSMAYDSINGNLYLLHGNQTDNFSKYDVSAETWDAAETTTLDAPGIVYNGGALVYLDGYVYGLKGYGLPEFWRYDISNSRWDSISTPTTVGNAGEDGHVVFVPNGSQCADATGCLFVLRGANTNTFWRYDISARTWVTNLSTTNLGTLQAGSSMCWNGSDYLYVLRGNNTYNFYRYSISGNAWTALTDITADHAGPSDYPTGTRTAYYGGGITCLGTTVYAIKGGADANGSNHFHSFDGTSWTDRTVVPQRTYIGSALTNNGTYVYLLTGNLRGDFYRYNPGSGTWSALTSLPAATYYTASLSYDGSGNIYAISGDYDTKMWRYNISGNSWTRVADLPARVGYNNALAYDTVNNLIYVQGGMATTNIWRFTPTTNNYISSATWISDVLDFYYVGGWDQVTANHPTPGSSSISFAFRSSTDKVTWSDWETVVSNASGETTDVDLSAITTPARRYLQIKVTLTSDGSNTPTLNDLTVTFTKDSTPPTNPTVTGYSDRTMGTSITSGSSYYYINPYFSFSGASDSQSGLAGYYVYFGTQSDFNPASSEDYYQTGTTYELNTVLAGNTTYYLRIRTKDNAGNLSSATTAFTYVYNGISSVTASTWTSRSDFEATGISETNINTAAVSETAMTLDSVSNGAWLDLPAVGTNALGGLTMYNDHSLAWDGSDTIYILRSANTQTFLKYSISGKTYTALANVGTNAYYGSAMVYVSPGTTGCADTQGCLYATMGGATNGFRRYDIQANSWTAMTVVTGTVGYGGGLAWNGGDYIFATRGAGTADFYRYSISGNSWAVRATPDATVNYGGGLVYISNGTYCADAGGCIFGLRGGGSNHFWRYDVNANTWTYKTAPPTASPAKGNYGATMVYHDGYLYLVGAYAATDFVKYDIANDLWSTLADLPATHYYGSSNGMVYDTNTDTIYLMRSYNEYSFFSYDVTNNQWLNPAIPHGLTSSGLYYSGVAFDGSDTLYVARGNNLNDFYKYTISTQIWQRLSDIPMRLNYGSDLIYVNGKVYALTGSPPYGEAATRFYSYDPTTDFWTRLTDTPNTVGYGTSLVYDGVNTIYTARGAGTTTYYSYSISGNTWSTQASVLPGAANEGSCAVRDGNYVYEIRSSNTLNIYRCTLDTDNATCTWSPGGTLTSAPAGAGGINLRYGGACTVDDGNIFVPRGNTNNLDFLVYNISGNSWTSRSLNNFYYYGKLLTGPDHILYGFRGYNTSTMDRYVQATSTTGFVSSGSWTSQIVDLGSVYDLPGLEVNDSRPSNTSLKYETKSCSNLACATDPNDSHWSAWDEVSNLHQIGSTRYYMIDSTPARYLQIKVTFTSDQIYTPTVNDLTVKYYVDGTAPSNPTSLISLDSPGGDEITSGNWYNHDEPYFVWSGASDNSGGIGISGYYVYFGTVADFDPASSEDYFQTDTTYTPDTLVTGSTYYLRIKTKDYASNVSASAYAAFTYSHDNVAPSRPTNITATPSVPTAVNSFTFSWTAGSDSGGSPFFQYCYMRYFDEDTYDASETCISSSLTSVSGIEALAEGVNTFRVRSKDEAGNYSNNGEWETASYRYAVTPPTLPISVQHGAVEGDAYSHTFSWNEPLTHSFDITAYCYQVNEEPTASYCSNETYGRWTTSSETDARFLAAFRTPNTQPGTNYFYIVAKDEAGNVDWNADFDCESGVGCITFTSSTISPNTPRNFSLTDVSDRAAEIYRLTLGWKEPADNPGSELYKYNIYRSTDETNFTLRENLLYVEDQEDYAYTDVALDNETTYYYKITAVDLAGAESDYTSALSLKPEGKFTAAPDLSGTPTITPRIRSAVIEWFTEDPEIHPATSFVLYGTTQALGEEQGNSELTGEHSVTLVDLSPDTTYYIKLKWVDQDGNIGYSLIYNFTTNDAPSAPTNLEVSPVSSSTNSFTFSWEEPIDEGVTIGGYYYSVNNLPNEENTTLVTTATVGPIPAATQQGVNTFYVVAVDDVGNYNFNNYASVTFTISTTPPGAPTNISITDSSVRALDDFALTLRWISSGNNVDHYNIYRSTDGQNYALVAETASLGYLDSGLETANTYYYKINAEDNAKAEGDFSDVVSKQPTGRYLVPPAYTSDPEVTVTSTTATISWTTDRGSSSFVNYDTTVDLQESKGSLEETLVHEVELTGLNPSTTYYYKVQSFDEARDYSLEEALSEQYTFTTSVAPVISDVKVEDVRQTTALVRWKTTTVSTSVIKYGQTTGYGQTIDDSSSGALTLHTVKLEGLEAESLYHVKITGTDVDGNLLESDDYVFQTLAFPRIFNVGFEPVKEASSATIKIAWETNVDTDTIVEYAPEGESFQEEANSELVKTHEIILSDLQDNTVYQFRAKGRDQYGNVETSEILKYDTPFDTRPPKISEISLETAILGTGKEATSQIIISWKTDEIATSQVEYGEGVGGSSYTNKTVEDGTMTNSHVVIISDLTPSKSYHLRVISKDGAANETKSEDNVIITGRATESVFDLILTNLQEIFGWLGKVGDIIKF